jgi:hypothetical protein
MHQRGGGSTVREIPSTTLYAKKLKELNTLNGKFEMKKESMEEDNNEEKKSEIRPRKESGETIKDEGSSSGPKTAQ